MCCRWGWCEFPTPRPPPCGAVQACHSAYIIVLFVLGRPVIYGVLCVADCRPVEKPAWIVVHHVCGVFAGGGGGGGPLPL